MSAKTLNHRHFEATKATEIILLLSEVFNFSWKTCKRGRHKAPKFGALELGHFKTMWRMWLINDRSYWTFEPIIWHVSLTMLPWRIFDN